ncbi:relaxase/mobilization nuclease domain-containing protein [Streptomyces sp. NBC_01750]|uniref:relaxase/mobilization nuclease domain-containing protein n=1 Tax=Streptomyces sp. NBC_01750 TaxID=2975928 RepID=UPI002DD91E62|nr:mobilization protein [Streptomyces sp. NBC_01750]WSD38138.1 mobilization protein [Streptomyces sp. NBC_01750]
MIPKKAKSGGRTTGLLYYLYGPGRANEHVDPHMVAAWDNGVPDPGRTEGTNIPLLASLLDAPLYGLEGRIPAQHVYHVPVSNDASDRILSDEEWAEVAREIMDAAGIAPKGDPMGARWVAVRHDPQHIHIVATLARQDGRAPILRRDMVKMQARARELEVRYGLRRLTSGDKTASRWPTTAEAEKAVRKGRDEAPRVTLQEKVREAAAVAGSDDEFFGAIQRAGIRLNKRTAPDGTITGYSVALPGDRTGAGRAVWFSGSRLAPDLSLPRVRERWTGAPAAALSAAAGQTVSKAAAWQAAAEHVHQAAAILGQAGNDAGAGEMVALSDFLTTYAAQAPAEVRQELRDAARTFERAGRAPTSRQMNSTASNHLRMATQLVAMSASLGVNGGEAAAAILILVAVALAVTAAMRFHQAGQHRAQEQAAARAGFHLRAATEVAYGASAGSGRQRGSRATWQRTAMQPNGPALVEAYTPVVRGAIPAVAERVLGEAAWPALAATLKQVENAGYEPGRVLAEVAALRGFGDAESVAEVLVWRLQRRMVTDTADASTDDSRQAASRPAGPAAEGTGTSGEARTPTAATTTEEGDGETPVGPVVPPPVVGRGESIETTPLGGSDAPSFGDAVRQGVPAYASAVLADPASATLAAYLIKAAGEGHQPAELLADVAAARDLADADSVAQVLTWRLQGRLSGGANAGSLPRITGRKTAPARPQTRVPGERTAAERAAQEAAQRRDQPRRPRR